MQVKKFIQKASKVVLCSLFLFATLSLQAQSKLFSYKNLYSNLLFSDSALYCQKDENILIISSSLPALYQIYEDTLSQYYEWSKYENGFSITHSYKEEGKRKGTNSFYEFYEREFTIFDFSCIGIYYNNKLIFFRIDKIDNIGQEKVFYLIRV